MKKENIKNQLHPRNLHHGRYNFNKLVSVCPSLMTYVKDDTINFSDPSAVKLLNQAILMLYYNINNWDIPSHNLCPPIPGRADYIHYAADLLSNSNHRVIPKGPKINVLDIGIGANCVYPLIGNHQYGWNFVGSDIEKSSIESVNNILKHNPQLDGHIVTRLQNNPNHIFQGIIQANEKFDLTICNPPFHESEEAAREGTKRKNTNLGIKKDHLNFKGKSNELWCPGGEVRFIKNMIEESKQFKDQCLWFTTLVSKKENLSTLYGELKRANVSEVKTFNMSQGQKQSRFIAWTFLNLIEQNNWSKERWI